MFNAIWADGWDHEIGEPAGVMRDLGSAATAAGARALGARAARAARWNGWTGRAYVTDAAGQLVEAVLA